MEKRRSQLFDSSSSRLTRDRTVSKNRLKNRSQSSGLIPQLADPNINIYFQSNRRDSSSFRRGISHSRTRAASNLRAASKANFTASRHRIHFDNLMHDNMLPDFPIPLPDESSEFIVLPPKQIYQGPPEHLKPHHHRSHQHHYIQQQQPPQQQHQQMHQHFYQQPQAPIQPQMVQPMQAPVQTQVSQRAHQQIQQQMAQPPMATVDLTASQATRLFSATPAQQADILGQISQQVFAAHQKMHSNDLLSQLQQQNQVSTTPAQQLEYTLQKLQNLYINQNQNQVELMAQQQLQQQQNQQLQQYLALQGQNIDPQQQQLSQIQNLLANGVLNQQQGNQLGLELAKQQQQNQQQQYQYMNFSPENQMHSANLKSSKMPLNFLGMMFEQPNQNQFG